MRMLSALGATRKKRRSYVFTQNVRLGLGDWGGREEIKADKKEKNEDMKDKIRIQEIRIHE